MTLSTSIDGGLAFLRAVQTESGYWSDWQLPPGESRMWTTAYVGYRLAALPLHRQHQVKELISRANAWLSAAELPGGGWGYSDPTGADADSTALAMLSLGFHGADVGDTSLHRLCRYQNPDGGFSTYAHESSYGAWIESHAEVSAAALLALISAVSPPADRIARGLRYAHGVRRADGLWNSYWWTSCLYATEAMLSFFKAANEDVAHSPLMDALQAVSTSTAFDSALLLLCLAQIERGHEQFAHDLARSLAADQLPDGSWPNAPILRLTDRRVSEPWSVEYAGPLFADPQRVFTTATVVSALATCEATTGSIPSMNVLRDQQ